MTTRKKDEQEQESNFSQMLGLAGDDKRGSMLIVTVVGGFVAVFGWYLMVYYALPRGVLDAIAFGAPFLVASSFILMGKTAAQERAEIERIKDDMQPEIERQVENRLKGISQGVGAATNAGIRVVGTRADLKQPDAVKPEPVLRTAQPMSLVDTDRSTSEYLT